MTKVTYIYIYIWYSDRNSRHFPKVAKNKGNFGVPGGFRRNNSCTTPFLITTLFLQPCKNQVGKLGTRRLLQLPFLQISLQHAATSHSPPAGAQQAVWVWEKREMSKRMGFIILLACLDFPSNRVTECSDSTNGLSPFVSFLSMDVWRDVKSLSHLSFW